MIPAQNRKDTGTIQTLYPVSRLDLPTAQPPLSTKSHTICCLFIFRSCFCVDILHSGEDGGPVIEWDERNGMLLTVPDEA